VYGDGQKYLVAAVWLSPAGAAEADREAMVEACIAKVNAQLASYETIKRFVIVDQPLTVEGGHLTPTLKVKRKAVYAAFRDRFEALYAARGGA
jgi:long-chain acyl-CoA synthetase